MSLFLEVVAHGLTAVLATWLGLLVVTRGRHAQGARVFAFLCVLLLVWSVAIIGERLGSNAELHAILNVLEDFGAFLLPAATAHLAISVALEGRRDRWATGILAAAYGIGLAAWVQTAVDPEHPILPLAPHFEPLGIPGEILGWGFILARAGIFAAGIGWLIAALRRAGNDVARQRQVQITLATLGFGIAGGMARILPEGMGGPPWVGVSLVAAAAVLAVYAVLAQRLFAGAAVTGRAFRLSVLLGIGVAVYVGVLLALDRAVSRAVGLDLPLVIALAVVATIALFDPVADLVRGAFAAGGRDDLAQARLIRALGDDLLSARRSDDLAGPALARLVRTFDLTGAAFVDAQGETVAAHGLASLEVLPTRVPRGSGRGYAAFGLKRSGLPLTADDLDLVRLAMSYLDAARRLGERTSEQATALAELSREGDAVDRREVDLADALAVHPAKRPGLHVYAMGPLRAEIDGEPIRQWGGPKAGSRQAEAVFAFLFDRGERGVGKDEIIEVVWPDTDLERADVAFHRTMLGLRSVLAPGRGSRTDGVPISFTNDRYRLGPDVVAWSDVGEFEDLLARARQEEGGPIERVRLLEAARSLYRADLLDDCPFYGDSAEVEERREILRERYVDLLVDLGIQYAERDRSAATEALRRAAALTSRDLPIVTDWLARLAAPAVRDAPAPAPGS